MIEILGYTINDLLYKGKFSSIYRVTASEDASKTYILKILNQEYPTALEIAKIKHEYSLLQSLDNKGIPKVYSLEKYKNQFGILIEDIGAISLKDYFSEQSHDLEEIIKIMMKTVDILAYIHANQIIHKDINPSNIIYNEKTSQIQIIDFGIASKIVSESQSVLSPNLLEGTLAYISPEQTGRMNRTLDYRTDFYSLGATFYQLVTKQLPFSNTDMMELIHSHLAKTPRSPSEVDTNIPQAVSDIILKCMNKTAEERYSSAESIKYDMEYVCNHLSSPKHLLDFIPGKNDINSHFHLTKKLYGRDEDISNLIHTFDKVTKGSVEMMFVSGYSGIGKSALVHEIYKPITQSKGYFISGKFDQFSRNIPYTSIIQAFQDLIRQLLTESDERIKHWSEKISKAINPNGQIIVEVIPELELIIGKQADVPEIAPPESQNRFNRVFSSFVQAFASVDHPLVLFLDDLQWADLATLKLIKQLLTSSDLNYLFFIGAYRDNEVEESHPFKTILKDLEDEGKDVNEIILNNLEREDIRQLVQDSFSCDHEDANVLAAVVIEKTRGNPFFVNSFLKALYDDQYIFFDISKGKWTWDIKDIDKIGITDNVVDLMVRKIKSLPSNAQDILKFSACIGNIFDIKTLSNAVQKKVTDVVHVLYTVIQEGLVIPLSNEYKFLYDQHTDTEKLDISRNNYSFKFLHDRVQQAAYSLITEELKPRIHYQVGWLIYENTNENDIEEKVFDFIEHINKGIELIQDTEELWKAIRFNYLAGKRAKHSMAYETALEYLETAFSFLPVDTWAINYNLTLNIHKKLLECSFILNNNERADEIFKLILQNAKSNMDKAEMYTYKVMSYQNQGKYQEAVEAGIEGSKLVGINVIDRPNHVIIGCELVKTTLLYWKVGMDNIKDLPILDDPEKKIAMVLMTTIVNNGYFTDLNTSFHAMLKAIQVSLKYGNTKSSAFAYIGYAIMLSWVFGKYEIGYKLGEIALEISEQFEDPLACRNYFAFGAALNHFVRHASTDREYLRNTFEHALEQGDTIFAAYGLSVIQEMLYYEGRPLCEVMEENRKGIEFLTKTKNPTNAELYKLYKELLAVLTGEKNFQNSMFDGTFDHEAFLEKIMMPTNKYMYYITNLQFQYLLGNYREALEWTELANPLDQSSVGQLRITTHYLYASLTYLALYNEASMKEKRKYKKSINKMKRKFASLAKSCPENFKHMYDLVSAEYCRIFGRLEDAKLFYQSASQSALENNYLQNHAIINELTGKFYLDCNEREIAIKHLTDARYGYLNWGCKLKVDDLDSKYGLSIIKNRISGTKSTYSPDVTYHGEFGATVQHTTNSISHSSASNILDISSIIKSSQTISGEIVLERLLEKLMRIVLENAGAQKGYFLLEKDGNWFIEARGEINTDNIAVLESTSIANHEFLPSSLVQYVARVKDAVVLHDATTDPKFSNDPYIRNEQVKSVLCMPILHQKKLTGILYLENNLSTHVFTKDRIEVLNMLSSQASISIENAKLYEGLDNANQNLNRMYQVSEILQRSINMKNAAKEILPIICNMMSWKIGVLWWQEIEASELVFQNIFSDHDVLDGLDQNKLLLKSVSDEKYIMNDVARDLDSDIAQPLFIKGIKRMYRFPIVVDKEVIGMLLFFDDKFDMPDQLRINIITEMGDKILQFYERQQAHILLEKKVQERTQELEETLKTLKQTQNQLVESEKMSALGNLVAGVAHEINTPLGIGVTATSHLKEKTNLFVGLYHDNKMRKKDLTDYVQVVNEATNMIQANLGRATELIRSFKQVAVDQTSEVKRAFNIRSYIREILLSLKPELGKSNVVINIDCLDQLSIESYPGAFSQILTNFIMNSIIHAFSNKEGEITIIVKLSENNKLKLIYKDNGKGMDEEIAGQIFEPFFTTNRSNGGTGLGMHIVYNLVTQRLQGTITCKSVVGEGTTFEINCPLGEEDEREQFIQ